jgi:outer membrane protein assembly factor BamB
MKNRVLACLIVGLAILLGSCGGGGGSGSTSANAPRIEAFLLSFPTGGVPSGYGQAGFNSVVSVWITDTTTGSTITSATVTVNGVSLAYLAADQAYESAINVAPGEAVTLSVTAGGNTYTASSTQYSAYPTIASPASGATWSSLATNIIEWSGVAPTADSVYALGVTDTNGGLVWPSGGSFMEASSSTTSAVVSSGSLTAGNGLVVVGLEKGVDIHGAATNSMLVIGGFTYSPITITNGPTASLASIAVTPSNATVANGQTRQMTATGTYSNATTQDLTTQVTWSSSDTSKATVSSTGLVTGVAYGSATITATSGGVSNFTVVNVFQPTPSPTPPLSQAVAYQIDYAHSGRAVFADAVTFPTTTPAWSVTLDGDVSYPLIANGKVFVLTSAKSLYALDQQTGNVAWGPLSISSNYRLPGHAYDNGKIFVVNSEGLLSSFNAATGQVGWTTQLPDQTLFNSAPTAVNGIVYVAGSGSAGTLYAIAESDGSILWRTTVWNGQDSSPAVSDDGVFVSYPGQVYKFSPVSGVPLWHYNGSGSGGGGFTAVYANGRLYARDWSQPDALVFDATNGSIVGNFTSAQIPAASTTTIHYLSSGTLRAINLTTNAEAWHFSGDGSLVSAPVQVNGTVIIGSASGNVYALDATSGSQVWSANAGAAIAASTDMTAMQLTGLGVGEGFLVVPASTVLTAWRITGP